MSHLALYRTYRPTEFNGVVGQDAIIKTLKNEVVGNRISHAYLFSGPRGTGKTSVAKILARAVNCSNLDEDGETCGKCESCIQSEKKINTDIVEIDAASNNGVDNIRTLIEEAKYLPQYGKYKVYIIDEVHMLSQSAFNALLKTIEEPNSNVIFILATTELHKVPKTIVSRCQQFQFKLLSSKEIYDTIDYILDEENYKGRTYNVTDEAIEHIAELAKGSMRDALSILDQCISYESDLTLDDVKNIFGEMDSETVDEMACHIDNKQISALFECLDEQIMNGKSLSSICMNLYDYYKEKYSKIPEERYERYLRILGELDSQLRLASSNHRVIFEVNMIKMCKPQMEKDITSLSLRIKELEDEIESLKEYGFTKPEAEPEELLPGFIEMIFPKSPKITMEVINE